MPYIVYDVWRYSSKCSKVLEYFQIDQKLSFLELFSSPTKTKFMNILKLYLILNTFFLKINKPERRHKNMQCVARSTTSCLAIMMKKLWMNEIIISSAPLLSQKWNKKLVDRYSLAWRSNKIAVNERARRGKRATMNKTLQLFSMINDYS